MTKLCLSTLLAFTLVFSFGLNSFADNVEQIQGVTKQEREIRWIWKYLGSFVRSCVQSGQECQNPEIKSILLRVMRELPAEPQATNSVAGAKIQFLAESQNPNVFKSDAGEIHRVAVTAMQSQAVIYINSERLGTEPSPWIGILVHEVVHHLGIADDATRLPDRAGAAVASHVKSVLQRGSLEEFNHADTDLVLFGDPAGDRPLRILLHSANISVDQEAMPNPRVPICRPGESLRGQTSTTPLWRVINVRGDTGKVKVRASARVNSTCVSPAGSSSTVLTNFTILVNLDFKKPFDPKSAWWELPSQLIPEAGGNSDGTPEMVDIYRTFRIESIVHDRAQYAPGETWKSQLIIESMDGFVPESCYGTLTANLWFFNRTAGANMFDNFASCQLTSLGKNRWQVNLSFPFPPGARSDLFSLSFLWLKNSKGDRFAVSAQPVYASLINRAEEPALTPVAWGSPGQTKVNSLYGKPIVRSFRISRDKAFWIVVEYEGSQMPETKYLDIDFIIERDGLHMVPQNVDVEKMKEMILEARVTKTAKGFSIGYRTVLPATLAGFPVLGFKVQRFNIKTSDYSWNEVELLPTEGFFLTDSIPQ